MSKFAENHESVAAALRAGLSLEAAADMSGVSASTVRTWQRRGRRESESEYGAFLRVCESEPAENETFTMAELDGHLIEVIRRKKSVAAMALWVKLHGQDRAPLEDEFSQFDPPGYR